jgi:hypothetical protein
MPARQVKAASWVIVGAENGRACMMAGNGGCDAGRNCLSVAIELVADPVEKVWEVRVENPTTREKVVPGECSRKIVI